MIHAIILGFGAVLYAVCAVAAGALLSALPPISLFGLDLTGVAPAILMSWSVLALVFGALALRARQQRRRTARD